MQPARGHSPPPAPLTLDVDDTPLLDLQAGLESELPPDTSDAVNATGKSMALFLTLELEIQCSHSRYGVPV